MVTNEAEETYFLVKTENGTYSLPSVNLSESGKSPLGSIMEVLLAHVGIESESLRLLDLTNIRGNGKNMPLFVFDALEKPSDLDSLLNEPGKLAWKKSSEISEILTDLELDSVPIYH
ncbi:hypothetical protein SAMN05216375_1033 [Trichococcus ilyis]|uniref:Uncharacterized protein n=2 Tax=Trichococcus ilyis TaxID=640938 RepID=A0A143YJM1_9LACT|nr:Hypothetical protein TR210_873 [Trichococcus ilyis]SEI70928.1 hypothetical protein SAMN05216375_1033 [Trichococcus ilyis]